MPTPWTAGSRALAIVVLLVVMSAPWVTVGYLASEVSPWAGSMFLAVLAGLERIYGVAQAAARFVLTGRPTNLGRD